MFIQQDVREQTDTVASTGSCYNKCIPIIKCCFTFIQLGMYIYTDASYS